MTCYFCGEEAIGTISNHVIEHGICQRCLDVIDCVVKKAAEELNWPLGNPTKIILNNKE